MCTRIVRVGSDCTICGGWVVCADCVLSAGIEVVRPPIVRYAFFAPSSNPGILLNREIDGQCRSVPFEVDKERTLWLLQFIVLLELDFCSFITQAPIRFYLGPTLPLCISIIKHCPSSAAAHHIFCSQQITGSPLHPSGTINISLFQAHLTMDIRNYTGSQNCCGRERCVRLSFLSMTTSQQLSS